MSTRSQLLGHHPTLCITLRVLLDYSVRLGCLVTTLCVLYYYLYYNTTYIPLVCVLHYSLYYTSLRTTLLCAFHFITHQHSVLCFILMCTVVLCRGWKGRVRVRELRVERAVTHIQQFWRGRVIAKVGETT